MSGCGYAALWGQFSRAARGVHARLVVTNGFSSIVTETADGYIRRTARTPEAEESFTRECRFLPELAARLPVPVPLPLTCEPGRMLYRKIPGDPLQAAMLARIDQARLAAEI